jgi:hypothetical protein
MIFAFILLSSVPAPAIEGDPKWPTSAQIAKIFGIETERVSESERNKRQRPKLGGLYWRVSYEISGEQGCGLSLALYEDDRLKEDVIVKTGAKERNFQKITTKDGDVIYFILGERESQGKFDCTTLISHENDWDLRLWLRRAPGVEESKQSIPITKGRTRIIGEIQAVIRASNAQQGD